MSNFLGLPVGSAADAKDLLADLIGATNATMPNIDLFDDAHTIPWDSDSPVFKPVRKLRTEDLVEDYKKIMSVVKDSLREEFESGRITGAKYAETFLALTQAGLATASQWRLGKDQAFWLAAKTQADSITAVNQNELVRVQALLARTEFALNELKLANEDSAFGTSEYQRTTILPEQKNLIHEQMESQRAQTLDARQDATTRVDPADGTGATLLGLLGAQKGLYKQQKQSYIDDGRIKAVRVFSDIWSTKYTVDQSTVTPPIFSSDDQAVVTFASINNTSLGAVIMNSVAGVDCFYELIAVGSGSPVAAPTVTAGTWADTNGWLWQYVGTTATPNRDAFNGLFAQAKNIATT